MQLLQSKWSAASTKEQSPSKHSQQQVWCWNPGNFSRVLLSTWHHAVYTANLEEVSHALFDTFINHRTKKANSSRNRNPEECYQRFLCDFPLLDVNPMEVIWWHKVTGSKQGWFAAINTNLLPIKESKPGAGLYRCTKTEWSAPRVWVIQHGE